MNTSDKSECQRELRPLALVQDESLELTIWWHRFDAFWIDHKKPPSEGASSARPGPKGYEARSRP